MKKLVLTLILLGFSATVLASRYIEDEGYGSSYVGHFDWWVYVIAAPFTLAIYAAMGWLVYKSGQYWYATFAAMLVLIGSLASVPMAVGLALPIGLAALAFDMHK